MKAIHQTTSTCSRIHRMTGSSRESAQLFTMAAPGLLLSVLNAASLH